MKSLKKIRIFLVIFLTVLPVLGSTAEQYERLISLAPSITENLYSLGLEEELIAVTSYCNCHKGIDKKEKIGNLTNPNIEKIFSLSPDLVLALKGTNRPQTIEKLKSLGLNVVVFDDSDTLDGIMKTFIQLGELTQREKKARELVKEIESEVESIDIKLKALPPVKVFWEVGAKPLVTAGGESFANEFIRYSGGINIFADASAKYPRVSREEVLKRNPEVIILVTMGDVTEKEKLYWRKFEELDAVKSNRIYVIDADKVCRPTPLSFLRGLKEVAKLLHPKVFGERGNFD